MTQKNTVKTSTFLPFPYSNTTLELPNCNVHTTVWHKQLHSYLKRIALFYRWYFTKMIGFTVHCLCPQNHLLFQRDFGGTKRVELCHLCILFYLPIINQRASCFIYLHYIFYVWKEHWAHFPVVEGKRLAPYT